MTLVASEFPTVTASSVTVTSGGRFTLTVRSENFADVAGIDFSLHYDAEAFDVVSASGYGSYYDVNYAADGVISVDTLCLNGIDGSVELLCVTFQCASNTPVGSYPISVSVGESYDSALMPLDIRGVDGKVTVNSVSSVATKATIYANVSPSTLKIGEETTITYRSNSLAGMATGNFEVLYDETLFDFVECKLESGMTDSRNGLYGHSVNADTSGRVLLSYASQKKIVGGNMFSVKLCAKADVDALTTVNLTVSEMWSEDRVALTCNSVATTLKLEKPPVEVVLPKLTLTSQDKLPTNKTAVVTVKIDGESKLAAGDFTLTYDAEKLEIVEEPKSALDSSETSAVLIVNPNYQSGTIKFSFICSDGISHDAELLTFKVRSKLDDVYSTELSCSGVGLIDSEYRAVTLEYPPLMIETVVTDEYRLISLEISDASGEILEEIPRGDFSVTVGLKNFSSVEDCTIIVSTYAENGKYIATMCESVEDVAVGATVSVDFAIENSDGNVENVKAFCVRSLGMPIPLCESLTAISDAN